MFWIVNLSGLRKKMTLKAGKSRSTENEKKNATMMIISMIKCSCFLSGTHKMASDWMRLCLQKRCCIRVSVQCNCAMCAVCNVHHASSILLSQI
jgi:hypothetical protein